MIDFVPAPGDSAARPARLCHRDVHGCLDVSRWCMSRSPKTSRPGQSTSQSWCIWADYVDRGLDSAQVVDWLNGGAPVPVERIVTSWETMRTCCCRRCPAPIRRPTAPGWRMGARLAAELGDFPQSSTRRMAALIPAEHQTFLRELQINFRYGDYFFVHAGIRPGVPLNKQEKQDMLWIREPFLSWKHSHEAIVVHGHTPRHDPEIRLNRIGIDTGAVMGAS